MSHDSDSSTQQATSGVSVELVQLCLVVLLVQRRVCMPQRPCVSKAAACAIGLGISNQVAHAIEFGLMVACHPVDKILEHVDFHVKFVVSLLILLHGIACCNLSQIELHH